MRARGFTMLELVVAVTVLAIVAAVLLPVVNGAADAFASSATIGREAERVAYAMERSVRLVRDWPAGSDPGTIVPAKYDPDSVLVFTDGRGIVLIGDELRLYDPSGESVLCRGVTRLRIDLWESDGVTPATDPTRTHRVGISIATNATELRTVTFVRAKGVGA